MNKTLNISDIINTAQTPEELLVGFLMGVPVDQEYIDAMKKLYQVCSEQNPANN